MDILVCNRRTLPDKWLCDLSTVYIGRPNPLGNPFVIERDGTRDEVIVKYRTWLYAVAKTDTRVRAVLNALLQIAETNEAIRLVCWCAPLPCHGDVIAEWLHEHKD